VYLGDMPIVIQGFIFIWLVCVFILSLCNLFHAIQVKKAGHIVVSSVLLLIEYILFQMMSELLHAGAGGGWIAAYKMMSRTRLGWWIILIIAIMAISITLASYFAHWKAKHVTPMSVKESMDTLHAGLCYWEDGGRIILSNKKMDEICFAMTNEILLNGQKFYDSIGTECVTLPDGTIKYFFHNLVEFENKLVHELIAADVTELYKKNELLEQETISLQKMNESLRRYNQTIEEVVRKQEILDTKVYIHDEMNRLMLVTTAMTETPIPEEEFQAVLTTWRNNAVLLGTEAEKSKTKIDHSEIRKLAELLGIQVNWTGKTLRELPKKSGEILIMLIREAIANAVKHAGAKNIFIDVATIHKGFTVTIANDGKRPVGKVHMGGGLSNIQRIVERQNGSLEIAVKERFELHITLPYV